MTDNIENLLLKHLTALRADVSHVRDVCDELIRRQSSLEKGIARIGGEMSSVYAEQMDDRHRLDALRHRVERIERRLELVDE